MNEAQLRDKIENTLLIPKDQKEQILSAKWDEKLIAQLNDFFDKFGDEEDKTMEVLHANMPNIFLKSVQQIESKYKTEIEEPQIKQIEQNIESI